MKRDEIKKFFDKMSIDRDEHLVSDPILNYEQEMRQKTVIELLNPSKNDLILDLGCGNARDIETFSKRGTRCVGIDLSEGMIKEARRKAKRENLENVEFIVGDAIKLPFKDNTFDKVSCSETIEHIPNWKKAAKEMKRVLKKDGLLVITTPNKKSLYGSTKIIFGLIGKILRALGRGSREPKHPYDVWKTQKEVLSVLRKNNFKIKEKRGICFIPGQWTYFLPSRLKKLLVRLIDPVEEQIRKKLTPWGYMIGILVICEK